MFVLEINCHLQPIFATKICHLQLFLVANNSFWMQKIVANENFPMLPSNIKNNLVGFSICFYLFKEI